MADKQSRLAEIYKAEKERGGGVLSTLGKRAKEKFDPRQMFNQKGFAAAALPSLFKAYDAVGKTKKIKELSESGRGGFSSAVLESGIGTLITETREAKIHSKIAAKNSESLPIMARDMNLMRQNITKLVKLQGGTAASRADMFFMKSGERESAYENRFTKEGGRSKTPTQVDVKPKEDSKSGIFGVLGGIFSLITGAIGTIVKTAVSSVGGILSFVGGILSSVGGVLRLLVSGLSLIVGSIGSIGKGLLNTILFLSKIPIIGKFFKVAALIGAGVGLYNILKPKKEGEENTEDGDTSEGPGVLDSITEKGKDLLNQGKETFGEYGGVAAGGIAAVGAASVASKVMGAGGLAAKTGTAVLDARTMSVGQLAKSTPTSRWGKFLSFVAKKSPTLFGRIGVKLAQAGALMAIPFAGWIGAALQLGFTFWTAWELFELWREFTNSKEDEGEENNSPTMSTTPIVEGAGGAAFGMYSKPGMEPQKDSSGASTTASDMSGYKSRAGVGREGSSTPVPVNIPGTSKEKSKTPTIEKFDYTKYKELVGKREGDGKYDTDNKVGFIGKYQFGGLALETFGYLKPGTGADKKSVYNPSNWTGKNGIASADDFKKATDVQENLMNAYTDMNLKGLQKSGVITGEDSGSAIASKLYAAHHGGVGGANEFFLKNKDTADFAFAGASVGKSAALMAKAYETGQIGGAEYSGLGGSGGTAVASSANPMQRDSQTMASSLGSMGSTLAGLIGTGGSSAVASVAANAPNMGNVIDSASTGLSEMLRMFDNAMASVTNVTNNTTQASAGPQGQGKLPSVYDDTFANLFQRVA